jgi:hypothetical protein
MPSNDLRRDLLNWQPEQPSTPCVVKNTFLHIMGDGQEELRSFRERGLRREHSEPARRTSYSGAQDDENDADINLEWNLGGGTNPSNGLPSRQVSDTIALRPCANMYHGQYLLLPAHTSLEGAIARQQQQQLQFFQNHIQPQETLMQPKQQGYQQLQGPYAATPGVALEANCLTLMHLRGLRERNKQDEDSSGSPSCADVQNRTAPADASRDRRRAVDPWSWEAGVVTVMVRQLPRQFTQRMFLQEVIRRGFEGLFDFLYLPYDFKKGINVGYGFVNFTDPEYALQFRDSLDGQYLDKYMRMKSKAIRVHPAAVQGYEANYRHFAHTKTGQKQDPSFSPIFLQVPHEGQLSQMLEQALHGHADDCFDGPITPGQLQNTPVCQAGFPNASKRLYGQSQQKYQQQRSSRNT